MIVICAWCKKSLGEKKGEGISHGICSLCELGERLKMKKMFKKYSVWISFDGGAKRKDLSFSTIEEAEKYANLRFPKTEGLEIHNNEGAILRIRIKRNDRWLWIYYTHGRLL